MFIFTGIPILKTFRQSLYLKIIFLISCTNLRPDHCTSLNTVMIWSFQTDRSGQTVWSKIRLGAVWSGSTLFTIPSPSFQFGSIMYQSFVTPPTEKGWGKQGKICRIFTFLSSLHCWVSAVVLFLCQNNGDYTRGVQIKFSCRKIQMTCSQINRAR